MKILLECNQPVPDFLEGEKPENGQLAFDDDTEEEGEDNSGDGDGQQDSWGMGSGDTNTNTAEPGNNTEDTEDAGAAW